MSLVTLGRRTPTNSIISVDAIIIAFVYSFFFFFFVVLLSIQSSYDLHTLIQSYGITTNVFLFLFSDPRVSKSYINISSFLSAFLL